jgi:hypothetical protein
MQRGRWGRKEGRREGKKGGRKRGRKMETLAQESAKVIFRHGHPDKEGREGESCHGLLWVAIHWASGI